MAVPDFQTFMLPYLLRLADGLDHRTRELRDQVADDLKLSPEDRSEMLASGKQARFANRFYWAGIYLARARVVENRARGVVRITQRGRDLLQEKPARIDSKLLSRYPEFEAFRSLGPTKPPVATPEPTDRDTPQERLEAAFDELHSALASELLERLKAGRPEFFERVVIDVMERMGYGGHRPGAGQHTGKPKDGGVDGIIDQDKLGLQKVYLQAKRWDGTVQRPEVQKFSGSLDQFKARTGVLITTSTFSKEARRYADGIDKRIALIDGERLVELMIEYDVGVSPRRAFALKQVDDDYFEEP